MAKKKTTLSDEEQREYTRMQQQVNKRLQRLEKAAKKAEFSEILNYSYQGFHRELKALGMGKTMSKSIPADRREFRKRMAAMQRFTAMPTSTIKGVKEYYGKRAATISGKIGVDVTWQDMAKIFESGLWDKLKNQYGSKTAWKMIGKVLRDKDAIKADIEAGRKITFKGEYGRRLNNADISDVLQRYLELEEEDEEEFFS